MNPRCLPAYLIAVLLLAPGVGIASPEAGVPPPEAGNPPLEERPQSHAWMQATMAEHGSDASARTASYESGRAGAQAAFGAGLSRFTAASEAAGARRPALLPAGRNPPRGDEPRRPRPPEAGVPPPSPTLTRAAPAQAPPGWGRIALMSAGAAAALGAAGFFVVGPLAIAGGALMGALGGYALAHGNYGSAVQMGFAAAGSLAGFAMGGFLGGIIGGVVGGLLGSLAAYLVNRWYP